MRTRHSQKKGSFSNCDKTNPVINDNELKSKSFCGLVGNSFQLVLGHCTVRLVIDPLNFATIFNRSDYAAEINNRARTCGTALPHRKGCLCDRNFANDICHALKLLATVIDSDLSSYKRRYKNEHESM